MSTATPPRLVTIEEFLKLEAEAPADVTLELIDGEVRERSSSMTTRGPRHSTAILRISQVLANWFDQQAGCEGVAAAGEVRCRIDQDTDTMIGIDVAYFEGPEFVEQSDGGKFFDGPPKLAVEVLSPSDTHELVSDRIRQLIRAGVQQVWVADPEFRTITVHRPGNEPRLFTTGQTLTGEPELPGLACQIEQLFGRELKADS